MATIRPSWLRVDSAIIFFRSDSVLAAVLDINIVEEPTNSRKTSRSLLCIKKVCVRTNRKTPAVTRVEECTRADTGVGAAIAAGSQLENGI